MPILECILIDASMDVIKFTSNDTELAIETIVEGDIVSKGIVALDAKMFSEIIRKLPDSEITIVTDENYKTTITCEKAVFTIAGKSGEDFSYLPSFEKDKFIYLSQFSLKELVRQTIFSLAENDTNKLMTGELMEVKGNLLTLTALDGHRIAIRKLELKENFDDIKVIIPGKTLNEVSKILSGGTDSDVRIFFSANLVAFEFDNTVVVSRLIDGEYFRVDQMISSNFDTFVNVNKKEFLDCIDRSTLLVKEGDKKPIIINITENELELKISSFLGSMNEQIEIEKDGKDVMIGFNPKLLMDALKVIDEEKVSMYLVNSKAPCVFKDDKETYIYLILPVNFSSTY
jgi:DNA polymerase-3 subunit beta